MADKSSIEWTDATWNPTTGCSIVSPGCTNCYAMKVANGLERRFDSPKYRGLTKIVNGNAVWTGEVRLDEAALLQPLKWKRCRRIFVNSMSDLFHESLSDADIDRVFAVMALCPQHTFQVLTKRAERMRVYLTTPYRHDQIGDVMIEVGDIQPGFKCVLWPFPNVWLGVSAERQEEFDERSEYLRRTPAAVRFISFEPLLGHIEPNLLGIHWAIVGGEGGQKARPMYPVWARRIRNVCAEHGVSFFFKQWGEWAPCNSIHVSRKHAVFESDGSYLLTKSWPDPALLKTKVIMQRDGKFNTGRLLDGREHNDFPVTDGSVSPLALASHDGNQKEAADA